MALSVHKTVCADEVWRTIISPDTYELYENQMNTYIPFFVTVTNSSLNEVITGLARFSDKRKDAAKAEKLFKLLEKGDFCQNVISDLRAQYEKHNEVWVKLRTLRNEVLAHSSAHQSEVEVFRKVGITPNDISAAVTTAREIMVDVSRLVGIKDSIIFETKGKAATDTIKLLKNLKAGNDARLKLRSEYGVCS